MHTLTWRFTETNIPTTRRGTLILLDYYGCLNPPTLSKTYINFVPIPLFHLITSRLFVDKSITDWFYIFTCRQTSTYFIIPITRSRIDLPSTILLTEIFTLLMNDNIIHTISKHWGYNIWQLGMVYIQYLLKSLQSFLDVNKEQDLW